MNIKWTRMAGFGSTVWGRDEKLLNIHTLGNQFAEREENELLLHSHMPPTTHESHLLHPFHQVYTISHNLHMMHPAHRIHIIAHDIHMKHPVHRVCYAMLHGHGLHMHHTGHWVMDHAALMAFLIACLLCFLIFSLLSVIHIHNYTSGIWPLFG